MGPAEHPRPAVLAIIPARGGSKGIPQKNIYPVAGKPLICYSIEAARASRSISVTVVSTDSTSIADVARAARVDVVMRPPELAADDTPMFPVVRHALDAVESEHRTQFDAVVLLQPTSPLRTATDIDAALDILFNGSFDAVMSVYRLPKKYHPQRHKRIRDGLVVTYLGDSHPGLQRQELDDVHKGNGAVYAMWRATVVEKGSLYGDRIAPYVMPLERSLDIDDWDDLMLAELRLSDSHRPGRGGACPE